MRVVTNRSHGMPLAALLGHAPRHLPGRSAPAPDEEPGERVDVRFPEFLGVVAVPGRVRRQVIDATVGGKLTVFPKVPYESLFA